MKQLMMDKTGAKDIVPIFSGWEMCQSEHSFGPAVREYYLIHFCLKGSGKLFDKYGCHNVTAGELFIIRPGEITTYAASEREPWEYSWIAFYGDMAELFQSGQSVYAFPMEIGTEVRELAQGDVREPAIYIALLFTLIYRLFGEKGEKSDLVGKIKRYIRFNYMNELTVKELAEYFGFDRTYLYRVFKAQTGVSIKEYLSGVRMKQAKNLLEMGYSVYETASAVGCKDTFNFSKAFKKHFGVPPSTCRKSAK